MLRATGALLLVFGLAVPCSTRAGFGSTKWGMTPAQVRSLYPGGLAESPESGETFYRLTMSAFGIPNALVTFAFPPKNGLNAVLLEFPNPRITSDLKRRDYARPAVREALRIRAALVNTLTKKFGRPSHQEAGASGSITVWRVDGEFARVSLSMVDEDRSDVRLWLQTMREELQTSEAERAIADVFARTDKETWGAGGAMGVRWGMGPADVRDVYPDLRILPFGPDRPIQTYRTQTFIEVLVGIHFDFYRGRLVEVTLGPGLRDIDTVTPEVMEGLKAESKFWRSRVLPILREKYGEPFEAPDPKREEDAASPQDASVDGVSWRWKKGEMGIELLRPNAVHCYLRYVNIGALGRAANEASQAHEAAQEEARKAPF